jgi:hypothetical protein
MGTVDPVSGAHVGILRSRQGTDHGNVRVAMHVGEAMIVCLATPHQTPAHHNHDKRSTQWRGVAGVQNRRIHLRLRTPINTSLSQTRPDALLTSDG